MKLHFLGTTGYHPNNSRQTACVMIPEAGIIFDAGTGIYRASQLIETDEINIFLSHTHLDHVIGLTFLFDVLQQKSVKVNVHVDESKISTIKNNLFHKDLFPIRPEFDLVPLSKQPLRLASGEQLTSFRLDHPGGCHGFRIDWPNRSMAYVTDTIADANSEYVKAIAGVDLLIHECYFPDGQEEKAQLTGHSCLTPVAEVASASAAKEVYLIHIDPMDEHAERLNLQSVESIADSLRIAKDQQVIEF